MQAERRVGHQYGDFQVQGNATLHAGDTVNIGTLVVSDYAALDVSSLTTNLTRGIELCEDTQTRLNAIVPSPEWLEMIKGDVADLQGGLNAIHVQLHDDVYYCSDFGFLPNCRQPLNSLLNLLTTAQDALQLIRQDVGHLVGRTQDSSTIPRSMALLRDRLQTLRHKLSFTAGLVNMSMQRAYRDENSRQLELLRQQLELIRIRQEPHHGIGRSTSQPLNQRILQQSNIREDKTYGLRRFLGFESEPHSNTSTNSTPSMILSDTVGVVTPSDHGTFYTATEGFLGRSGLLPAGIPYPLEQPSFGRLVETNLITRLSSRYSKMLSSRGTRSFLPNDFDEGSLRTTSDPYFSRGGVCPLQDIAYFLSDLLEALVMRQPASGFQALPISVFWASRNLVLTTDKILFKNPTLGYSFQDPCCHSMAWSPRWRDCPSDWRDFDECMFQMPANQAKVGLIAHCHRKLVVSIACLHGRCIPRQSRMGPEEDNIFRRAVHRLASVIYIHVGQARFISFSWRSVMIAIPATPVRIRFWDDYRLHCAVLLGTVPKTL